jgi:hypothetical protein
MNQIVGSDIETILGDFNVKVGKETYTNPPLAMKVNIMKLTTEEKLFSLQYLTV